MRTLMALEVLFAVPIIFLLSLVAWLFAMWLCSTKLLPDQHFAVRQMGLMLMGLVSMAEFWACKDCYALWRRTRPYRKHAVATLLKKIAILER